MASTDDIKRLRDMTGAGMLDCKQALAVSGGDVDKAVRHLREVGLLKAAKKAGRPASEGVVEAYIHPPSGPDRGRLGALVELDCETDFVARNDKFHELARELAMHIVAKAPRWVNREEVPEAVVSEETDVYRTKARGDGKPEQVLDKIVSGQLENFLKENCLLEQGFVRDEKRTVKQLIDENIAVLGENIVVRRFARFNIKED